MPKVLFVSHVAGFARFNEPLIRWWKAQGWEVHYAANGKMPIDCCDVTHQIPFERSPASWNNVRAYKQLKALLARERYDLLHCHTPMGSVVARLAARKARKQGMKVLYTAHGFHFFTGAPLANWLLYYPVEKLLAPAADGIITINQEDYDRARDKFRTQIHHVHGAGVDPTKFSSATPEEKATLRQEMGFAPTDFLALYVAEYTVNKNHALLVRAAEQLRRTHPHIKLLFAGVGDELDAIRAAVAAQGLQDTVHILGYCTNMPKLYRTADVCISASRREGLPVSLIEAMMSGLPIIATRIRGHVDLVHEGQNGHLFPSGDAAAFAEQAKQLADSADICHDMGEKSKELARPFAMERVVDETSEIYRQHVR